MCGSQGKVVSMGVISDGSYGIEKGLMYSFPVVCQRGGTYTIVQVCLYMCMCVCIHSCLCACEEAVVLDGCPLVQRHTSTRASINILRGLSSPCAPSPMGAGYPPVPPDPLFPYI